MGDDDANDANGKDKSEGKAADATSKGANHVEDGDENTDKSATNSEYILCKPCYEKEQYPKEDVAETKLGEA